MHILPFQSGIVWIQEGYPLVKMATDEIRDRSRLRHDREVMRSREAARRIMVGDSPRS